MRRFNVASAVVVLVAVAVGNAFAAPYVLTDLGTLGGGASEAYGINSSGQVVGWADTSSGAQHAFLDSGGTMKDLGTLGGTDSCAYGINSSGQVVGVAETSSGTYDVFLYTNGTMKDLTAASGGGGGDYAINDKDKGGGLSAGWSYGNGNIQEAWIYSQSGPMQPIGFLPGYTTSSCAQGINNSVQVVGWSNYSDILAQQRPRLPL